MNETNSEANKRILYVSRIYSYFRDANALGRKNKIVSGFLVVTFIRIIAREVPYIVSRSMHS